MLSEHGAAMELLTLASRSIADKDAVPDPDFIARLQAMSAAGLRRTLFVMTFIAAHGIADIGARDGLTSEQSIQSAALRFEVRDDE
jgi:hypothetical protein